MSLCSQLALSKISQNNNYLITQAVLTMLFFTDVWYKPKLQRGKKLLDLLGLYIINKIKFLKIDAATIIDIDIATNL